MESVYDKLIKALEAGNYNTVIEILTTTPLGEYLLQEIEKRGFNRKEVISAVAGGQLSTLITLSNITFEMALTVNNYVTLVKEGKYVDAIKLLVNKTDTVTVLNTLQGTSYTLNDLLASLTYHAVKSGVNFDEVKKVAAQYEGACKRGLASFLIETILNKLNANDLANAIGLLSKNLDILIEAGQKENAKNIAVLILDKAVELGNESVSIQSVNLLKSLGVISDKEIKEIKKDADQLVIIFSEETANVITNEVNSAIESKDPNRIVGVAERHKDLLQKTPLTIEGIDIGISVYEYLTKLAFYIREVEPNLYLLFDSLNKANESLKNGNLKSASSNATKALEIINNVTKQSALMALLIRISSIANKKPISLEEAKSQVDSLMKTYGETADLIITLVNLNEKYDKALMDKLYSYAKTDKGVAEAYAALALKYEATASDIEAILGEVTIMPEVRVTTPVSDVFVKERVVTPPTPLIKKIKDLGIDPLEFLKNRLDLARALVTKAASDYLKENSFLKARNIAVRAIRLGLDSELIKLEKGISGIEQSMYLIQSVNNIIKDLNEAIAKEKAPSSSFFASQLSAIRDCRKKLEELSNMPELATFQAKDGQPFSSSLKSSIGSIKELEILVEAITNVSSCIESYTEYINQISAGKITEEDFFNKVYAIVPRLDSVRKSLSAISSPDLKAHVESYKSLVTGLITDSSTLALAVRRAGEINKNVNDLLTALKNGLQFPEEGKKIVNLWFNAVISLKSIGEMAKLNLSKEAANSIERMYQDYTKDLSQLKTDLVNADVRLEDLLNIAENQAGISLTYEKPYFQTPVVGELEKYIKIGIAQIADIISRRQLRGKYGVLIPGTYVASFWKGFANVVTALLQPWEIWREVQMLISGANEFFRKVTQGDFKGAWDQITVPLTRFFTEDPAYAIGVLVGAIFMAKVGELIVKKLGLPRFTKELVINVLQGDPLGLAISYIAVPITKYTIKLIRGLVTTEGAKFDISGIEKMKDAIYSNVERRIATSAKSLENFYNFLKKYAKTVDETMDIIDDIINEKGIGYVRAVRDTLYDAVARAAKTIDDVNILVKTVSDASSPETVLKASRTLGVEDISKLNEAIRDLGKTLSKVKSTLNIDLTVDDVLKMNTSKISKLADVLKKVTAEIKDVTNKVYSTLKDSLEDVKKAASPDYSPSIERINRALLDYAMGNRSAIFTALDEFEVVVKAIDPNEATNILKKIANDLNAKGLTDLAKNIEKILNDVEVPRSKVLTTIKTSIVEGAKESLQELSRIPEISSSVKTLISSIDAGDLALVVKGFDQLSDSLSNVVKTVKNVDVLSALSNAAKQLADSIGDIKKAITGLGLDKFDFYKKMISELDKISAKINEIGTKTMEASLAVKIGMNVSEIAKSLGFNEVAEKLLKEQISATEAISEIRKKLLTQSIEQITPSLKNLDKMMTEMFKEPALFTVRMMLMNIIEEAKGNVSNLRVSGSIVKMLNEILKKYEGKLTPEVVSEIRRAINDPTLSNVSKVIDMIGYNPVLASAIDLAVFTKIIDDLSVQINEFATVTKSEAAASMLNKLSEVKKYVLGSDVIVERYAVAGLIDPSFVKSFSDALDSLKRVYPLLSNKIDGWKKTVTEFVNNVNEGNIKSALSIGKQLEKALSDMSQLATPTDVFAKIKGFFSSIKDKIEGAIKKAPRETSNLKVLKEFSDKIVEDVNKFGTIEPGNFGYIISDVDEVVGRGIKTAADFVPEVRKFLETKRASIEVSVDGYKIYATRSASLLPTELSLKYTFQLPSGGVMYADMVARPMKIAGETVNAVYTYINYDPTSLTDPAAKAIAKLAEKGDILSKIDPEASKILPKILIMTDFGSMPMSSIAEKAIGALIASLSVSLKIAGMNQLPAADAAIYKIYLQENLKPIFESLRDIAVPLPENIAKELGEKGIKANIYVSNLPSASGAPVSIAIGDIIDTSKISIEKIKVLEIPDLGKIVTIPIPTTHGEILFIPVPPIIEATPMKPDEIIKELEKTMVEIKVEPVEITSTLPPAQIPIVVPAQITTPTPSPAPVPAPSPAPTTRKIYLPPTVPKPPATAGMQVMTIGAGRPALEVLQY